MVDNKWNRDLVVKQTIISTDDNKNQARTTKEYSVPASKVTGFHYLTVAAVGRNGSSSRFQIEESVSRLLVILPNGDDHIHVTHLETPQDYKITIYNASKSFKS